MAVSVGIGAALGAALTVLVLQGADDADRGALERYELALGARIGPEAVPPSRRAPDADELFRRAASQTEAADRPARKAAREVDRTVAAEPPPSLASAPGGDARASAPRGDAVDDRKAARLASADRDPAPEKTAAPAQPRDGAATAAAEADLALTRGERREVQRRLEFARHDPGLVDGIFGPATRAAIGSWQAAVGLPPTGFLDREALALLAEQTKEDYRAWRAAERAHERERRQTRTVSLSSPVPRASPLRSACPRDWTGEIAYGQTLRCDIRGLREELRGMRENVVELFRSPQSL